MVAMRSRRAVFLLGLCAALAAGIALRLHTREQANVGGRIRPLDSDSAYHLRRARFAAANYPRTIQFDPMMNFPEGGVAIWPPLFDIVLATPAVLAQGRDASADAIERGAAWIPVLFGAGSILLAGLLAGRLMGAWAGVAAAVFLAVSPAHILWSQYAHTDQHAAESFCGLLALLLFLRSRERPAAARNAGREALAGAALAVAVLTWQGAIYWGAIFALALACEAVFARRSVARAAALTLGLAAGLVAAATAAWLAWLRPPLTYVSFGYFQPLFLAGLCGGTAAIGLAAGALRRTLTRRELALGLGLIATAALVTLPFAPALFAGLRNGIGYVAGSTTEIAGTGGYVSYPRDWLKGIYETQPLLADGPGLALRQLSGGFFFAPIVVLVWAARARRGARRGVYGALAIWGAVTLFLALSQRLNVYYAAPLSALALLEGARALGTRLLRRTPARLRQRRALVSAAAAIALALPMWPGLRQELASVNVPGSDLFETLEKMRETLPHPVDAYDPRLLGPPPFPEALATASSVMAPWSLGHMLLYNAEEPVVANNFGYGFLESIRFFLAESEAEALAIARRHRVRWIVATDLAARMNDYASYLGRPPYLEKTPGGLVPVPAYFSTLQARLYDFGGRGASLEGGGSVLPLTSIRLLFHSKSAIRRNDRWIPRWAVFEIVE